MLKGLFFLSLFFITTLGILLLRPDPIGSITHYSSPERVEARKKATKEMARFLVRNPSFLAKAIALNQAKSKPGANPIPSVSPPPALNTLKIQFPFQGSLLEFHSMEELNAWVFKETNQAPLEFLNHLNEGVNLETKLELLRRVSEIDSNPPVRVKILETCLADAKSILSSTQESERQLAQKYLEFYLETEPDRDLGKKRVDEILKASSKQSP